MEGENSVKSYNARRDHISDLPDELLLSIISRLTLREAVNTSVLSHRWRHLSASMDDLTFTWNSIFPTGKYDQILKTNTEPCREYKDRFVRAVNQFLELYKGPHIVYFQLSFCLGRDSASDMDRWISFAVKMGVQKLHFNLFCSKCLLSDRNSGQRELHIFRPEVLTQCMVLKLNLLFLGSSILGPGVTDQFGSLKVLHFKQVSFGQHEVQSLFSCCSKLESFVMLRCSLPIKLIIPGLLCLLEVLIFFHCSGVEEIEVSAANLTLFQYVGDLSKISFSIVPNLEEVHFHVRYTRDVRYIFSQLPKDLPMLKTLSFHTPSDWVQCIPESITTFNKVEELKLFFSKRTKFDVLKVFAVLRAFPLLQKFHLVIACPEYSIQGGKLEPSEYVYKRLEEVEIGGFCGTQNEIEFVIYLLKYVVSLKRLIIDPKMKLYTGAWSWKLGQRTSWGEGERERVCEGLQEFYKDSVVIIR